MRPAGRRGQGGRDRHRRHPVRHGGNAFNAAKAKGVPIVIADQIAPPGTTNTNQLTYVPGVIDQPSQIAWWIIADSKGKANAIIAMEADSPSSKAYVTYVAADLQAVLPGL